MKNNQHPWQNGPTELINHAIEHMHRESDFDQRIAFLLLDLGMETLLKTFLTLPDEVTQAQGKFQERKEASEGNFHQLTQGVSKAAAGRVSQQHLSHVKFYHDLRNKLYHQGNGITIPTDKVKDYAKLSVELLKTLLDVDLSDELREPEIKAQKQAVIDTQRAQIAELQKEIRCRLEELESSVFMAVELIEPKLILPSFTRRFNEIRRKYERVYQITEFTHSLDERLEFAKEIVLLIKMLIGNSELAEKFFAMRHVKWPFISAPIPHENIIYYLLMDDNPQPMPLLFHTVEIVLTNDKESWYEVYQWASLYPHIDPRYEVENEEECLNQAIEEGGKIIRSINEVNSNILSWIAQQDGIVSQ